MLLILVVTSFAACRWLHEPFLSDHHARLWLEVGRSRRCSFVRLFVSVVSRLMSPPGGIGRGATAAHNHWIYMQTIIEILIVTVKAGNAKKTGQPYSISEAHCVLKNDDGTPGAVGVLVVPKALEAAAVRGSFTATFGLSAASYGDQQGRIVAVLTGLIPLPANHRFKPVVAPAAAVLPAV